LNKRRTPLSNADRQPTAGKFLTVLPDEIALR
jgi:hypothetical protein